MAIGGVGWGLHDILEAYGNKQMQYAILWDYDDDAEQWLRNQTMTCMYTVYYIVNHPMVLAGSLCLHTGLLQHFSEVSSLSFWIMQ